MGRGWGLGPVFVCEWLTSSRRWQSYAARSGFVGLLIVSMIVVWWEKLANGPITTFRGLAEVGQWLFYAIVGTQITLVMLAAPAATAGSICLDRARGTLLHLMMTDLSDSEIVLGKLAARLVPVLGLLGCTLPVVAICTLLGGVDPGALAGSFLISVGLAVLGCTLSLVFSVFARKAHEVLLGTYACWIIWLLIVPAWRGLAATAPPAWFVRTDPFLLAFAPYINPRTANPIEPVIFLSVTLGLSVVMSACAVLWIRASCTRERVRKSRAWTGALKRWGFRTKLPGPSLDFNPVLWREWHHRRARGWILALWLIYFGVAITMSGVAIERVWNQPPGAWGTEIAAWVNGLQITVGFLLLSASAATVLAEERVRGSLDVLLATPLKTSTIVWGKWLGTFRLAVLVAVPPTMLISALALVNGQFEGIPLLLAFVLAQGATITSMGLAAATWISRLGRALAVTIVFYAMMAVGWLFVVLATRSYSHDGDGLMGATPFFGVGNLTYLMKGQGGGAGQWSSFRGWIQFWTAAYITVAAILLGLTLVSFDKRLGRVSEYPQRVRPIPKPSKAVVILE